MRTSSHQYRHANLVFRTCFWQHTPKQVIGFIITSKHTYSHSNILKDQIWKKIIAKIWYFLYRKFLFPPKKNIIPLTQTQQPLLEKCVRECGDHSNQSQQTHTHTYKQIWLKSKSSGEWRKRKHFLTALTTTKAHNQLTPSCSKKKHSCEQKFSIFSQFVA